MAAEPTTVIPVSEQECTADTDEHNPQVTAETIALRKVQGVLAGPAVIRTAQAMSKFGDHAIGWLAIGAVGALVDRTRRGEWIASAAGVAAAHGVSIAVKRTVRRQRPLDPRIEVLVDTPSTLSFPSSHSTSTTAAAVLYGELVRGGTTSRRLVSVLVPPMMASRLVLGVHYPSDVVAGSALGGAVALGVRRYVKRWRNRG
ncbi:5'-phosphoribosyl-monophospho-decaprenol phosphatase [Halopolyspora algeriensis]|uniref:5'-phosphoribosyl-monophospho-decaprenol phosphatase n=1 Tax=Halopolyspora algeriensis TaxID=1500506 RepID=A0A368W121_9ACTN|nr:phosphatase PAP2 family protein [Halopolyspora algeriensis]RCW47332.1 5'-phosphoribosyl-monophospho-decaprenol phosphatase [Halopolyspora algeriensis]TQM42567.1 5'-phosphoribosyl-monophospho-decaprenol phosphatase [Halopolyspora algeriensis]